MAWRWICYYYFELWTILFVSHFNISTTNQTLYILVIWRAWIFIHIQAISLAIYFIIGLVGCIEHSPVKKKNLLETFCDLKIFCAHRETFCFVYIVIVYCVPQLSIYICRLLALEALHITLFLQCVNVFRTSQLVSTKQHTNRCADKFFCVYSIENQYIVLIHYFDLDLMN